MKRFFTMLLIMALTLQSTVFALEKSNFQHNTYTINDEIIMDGQATIYKNHVLDFDIGANKLVVVSLLNMLDDKGNQLPEYVPNSEYQISYIALKETATGKPVEIWSGGYSDPSRMRFFRTTEAQNGKFTVSIGLESKTGATTSAHFKWKYALSLKILDSPEFAPLDSLGTVSGDKNFFLSSGPEGLYETDFYTYQRRQYLCRAPINGNANIYWSHLDETGKGCYFGILLTNKESTPIEATINALNYENAETTDEIYATMYTDIFINHAQNKGAKPEKFTLAPGQSKWLFAYQIISPITGETTGIINLSTNYLGQNLICTTYAFLEKEYLDYIPINTADWELEAQANMTSMRGSGNGTILNLTGEAKELPYEMLITGENIINRGENIYLTRLEGNKFYTSENKGFFKRIECGEKGALPSLSTDDYRQLNSYNCNFGTIYKIDLKMLKTKDSMDDGKKLVGKIKLSSRTCPVVAQGAFYKTFSGVINVAVWRTKNGKMDYSAGKTISLAKNMGIDPNVNNILQPNKGFQQGRLERSKEGVYWTFDTNIPFFDKSNDYSYYIVGSGMSSLPMEVSFEYEDIKLSTEPYTVYINEKPISFADTKPQIVNDRLLVPLRGIFENLGAQIFYSDQTITILTKDKVIQTKVGSTNLTVYNLKDKTRKDSIMDTPSIIIDNRTLIPLRAISENLGYRADWYAQTQAIFIN